ncbi:MAG: PKD domain-containing protein [bacterium]|nr:PKD domain-containing protein [bacterium]
MKPITLLLLLFGVSFSSYSQTWQDVGGGTNNSSHGMLVWNGQLVNLGSFNNPCNRVAVWDGTSWSCLGGGVGIVARAGCVWNGNLVVVGDFWNNFQPCPGCNGVAVWDGTSWTALDQGFNNDVLTCTVYNGDLIIGGDFTQANGVPINRVARWNTTTQTFESMGAVTDMDNDVRCMTVFDGELWVGGDFNNVGGNSPSDGVVKWDDANSQWIGGNFGVDLVGGVNETVRVLYVNPNDGNLYMGGEFPELIDGNAGVVDYNMSGIAMYNGSDWTALGTGLNEYCRAIHEYNGNLIAGGYFTTAGGVSCNKIARWDGTNWSPMGQGFDATGIDEYVKSAAVWNGIFFAGGAYTQAEGSPMNHIAQWYEVPTVAPVAGISASTNAVCEGGCIDFTDISTNNPTSWTWSFPGASTTSSTDQHPTTICYPSSGTYSASLTACNSNGCNTANFSVTINEIPTVAVNNVSICDGESTTLTATPSTSGGDYDWISTGETTQTITVSPTTTTSYDVVYTLNGCVSATETATVTVNPIPSVTVNSTTICAGESTALTATPSTGGGTFNWTNTGDVTATINVSPAVTTVYDVEYTLNGCTSQIGSGAVSVNPTYALNESVSVCSGETVNYPDGSSEVITAPTSHISSLQTWQGCDSIITTNVALHPDYNLTINADICSGDSYTFPNGTTVSNITTNISQTDNLVTIQGCDSTITTNVIVHAQVSEIIDAFICSGDSYTFPNGVTQTNITSDISQVDNFTTIYGCDSTITTYVSVTTVNVGTTENNNVITAQQSNATYQWIDCATNLPIGGATSSSFAPTSNGEYAVIVTFDGCSDTSDCVTISTLSLSSISTEDISLSPVPATNEIRIHGEIPTGTTYEILNISGEFISSSTLDETQVVSVEHLARGAYFIRIGTHTLRFTKM